MKLIKKLFIKNYTNINDRSVRYNYGKVAGFFGIITNLLLFVSKIFIGILSASITIIVDAINSLTDAGGCLLSLIGFKLSNKPADRNHPFGHARYEYVMALIIAMISFAVGITFAKSCIEKIITPTEISIDIITYIILFVAIIIKLAQYILYNSFSKDIDSDSLKANASDAFFDMLVSVAILISMIIMNIFGINLDGYIGLFVSLFIIYSSFKLILETINPLISEQPQKKLVKKIKRELASFDDINDFHDLIIHSYGTSSIFVTVHVEVPISKSLLECHELIDKIERHFEDELNINITIQIDPVDLNNELANEIHDRIEKAVRQLNSKIDIHGLRIVKKRNAIDVLFDIQEPFDKKLNKKEIINLLEKEFKDEKEKYEFIFTIDKPFV